MEVNNNFKYKFLYSPRTNYNNQLEEDTKLFIDLTHGFDPYSIKILKKHFKEHLGYLNKETFICVIKHHLLNWKLDLPNRETILIRLLSKLFEEIDINSTGEIQWKDFVNYILKLSKNNMNELSLYSLQSYTKSKTNIDHTDVSEQNCKYKYMPNTNIISYCFYIEKYKLLGIAHEGKTKIIFYDAEKRTRENIEIDLIETQKEINEYEMNELNKKTERLLIKKEKERERKIRLLLQLKDDIRCNTINKDKNKDKERLPTPDSIRKEINQINGKNKNDNINDIRYYPIHACFVDEFDLLFISSTNNKISAWKFNNKKYEFENLNNSMKIKEYNIEDNIPLYNCKLPQYCLCFDNSSRMLYSGQEDGKIMLWELTEPNPTHIFKPINKKYTNYNNNNINNESNANTISYTGSSYPQRKKLNVIRLSKIERRHLINGKKEKNKEEEEEKKEKINKGKITNYKTNDQEHKKNAVSCLLLINNLKLLCSTYYTGQIVLWDINIKKPKVIYNDQTTIIYQVIYNPFKNRIYTCGFEHEIYVYDPYNEENAIQKLKGHMSSISSISFNQENNELISIDIQGNMKIWDSNNNINFQTINIKEDINNNDNDNENKNHKQKINNNMKLNSNFYVESLTNLKQIIVYDENNLILFEKGKTLNPTLCDDNLIIGCSYNPNSHELITISTKRIKFWNIFNGKVNKIFEDLMNGADISFFELDKRYKKCYLGDNNGNVRCYNIINGLLFKDFKPHKSGIVSIIHSMKEKVLISGSVDLCVRIHSDIDDDEDKYKEIYILNNNINNSVQENNKLKTILFNEEDNVLIMALSKGMISYYDFNFNKFINDAIEKDPLVIRRKPCLSTITDLFNIKCLFISHENGDRYIITKINNKYYDLLSGVKFGNFIEGENMGDNTDGKKNIIYTSIYDGATYRLITGDHAGFITCYDLNILNEKMKQNYNSKKEALTYIQKINIPIIYKIQPYKQSITCVYVPQNLYPKILISSGSDSIVKLFDFEKFDYIESLKQISMKYTPVPIAICFSLDNPFGERIINKNKGEYYYLKLEEKEKKRKEKINKIIQNINKNYKHYLAINDQLDMKDKILTDNYDDNQSNEKIIYRCEIEPNLKMPQIDYENANRNDIINYSFEILDYNAKMKLISQINEQNLLPNKSSLWNYDVDFEYIIKNEKENFKQLCAKINNKEKDVKETEQKFQHISLTSSNYTPIYLNKLKTSEKIKFSDFIKEKLRVINLSDVKKKLIQTDKKEINQYMERHRYPHNLSPVQKIQTNIKYKPKSKDPNPNNNNNNDSNNNNQLEIKKLNTIEKNNDFISKNKKIFYNKSSNVMSPSSSNNNFNDVRFLECKNQFDEKYNELSNPLKLMIRHCPKKKLPKISQ